MTIVVLVEIPVTNLERAIVFYSTVFQVAFSLPVIVHGNKMAHFPFSEGQEGASAALAEGEIYKPSQHGAVIYFNVEDIDALLKRAEQASSAVLFPKTDAGGGIFVAEIEDSEGNRIAVQQMPKKYEHACCD